ncbi:MAG: hypothetical protein D6767_01210 [Candidatus Hydrogenedentota bacterium]|nr:MAG: hypothetical protein D6767_01210 [Candidatus Hydrogenedentota bacterium]
MTSFVMGAFFGMLSGFFGSMLAAGPASGVIFHQALLGKFQRAKSLALGSSVAETLYCGVGALGILWLSSFLKEYKWIFEWVGSILLLGTGFLFLKLKPNITEEPSKEDKKKLAHAFVYGLMLIGLNPLLILTWGIVIATIQTIFGLHFNLLSLVGFSFGVGSGVLSWFYSAISWLKKRHGRIEEGLLHKIFQGIGSAFILFAIVLAIRAAMG